MVMQPPLNDRVDQLEKSVAGIFSMLAEIIEILKQTASKEDIAGIEQRLTHMEEQLQILLGGVRPSSNY